MSNNRVKVDLNKIIQDALQLSKFSKEEENTVIPKLDEGYVAQQKVYNQVTEFVSQKTKDAHIALYKSEIGGLNRVAAELDSSNTADSNSLHSAYRTNKIDEASLMNSVYLHECYFANCFDPNSEVYMDSLAYLRLQRDFGSFEQWQKHFIAAAMACGEGWVVTGYNTFLRRYVITTVTNHSDNVMVGLYPVLVVDMWSHAYFKDYLNDKKSYLIAMMRQLNWAIVEERFKRADKIHEALK
jgi:superoxide dismutase, Fe-Mn family